MADGKKILSHISQATNCSCECNLKRYFKILSKNHTTRKVIEFHWSESVYGRSPSLLVGSPELSVRVSPHNKGDCHKHIFKICSKQCFVKCLET